MKGDAGLPGDRGDDVSQLLHNNLFLLLLSIYHVTMCSCLMLDSKTLKKPARVVTCGPYTVSEKSSVGYCSK